MDFFTTSYDLLSAVAIGFSATKKGVIRGMFTAFKQAPLSDPSIVISWSKVNTSIGDAFNQYAGYAVAAQRVACSDEAPMPLSMRKDALQFFRHTLAETSGKVSIRVMGYPELSYNRDEIYTSPYTKYSTGYDQFVHNLFSKEDYTLADNCAHALIGFAGELGELMDAFKKNAVYGAPLDCENIIEELGDLYFYIRGYAINEQAYSRVDVGLDPSTSEKFGDIINTLPNEMKSFTASTMTIRFNTLLELFSKKAGRSVTLEEIIDANYKKLQLRYPEGYTNTAALARADKA